MKKKMWQLGALVLILAALGALFYILKQYNEKQASAEAEAQDTALHISISDLDEVQAFAYTYNGENYGYELVDGTWYVKNDHSIHLTQYSIKAMASVLQNLEASMELTEVKDLAQYGLEKGYEVITAKTANGLFTLYLGDINEFTGEYYAMIPGTDKVYLLDSYSMQRFEKTVEDYTEAEKSDE